MSGNSTKLAAGLFLLMFQPTWANQTAEPSTNILTPGRQVLKEEPEIKPLTVNEERPGQQGCTTQTTQAECPKKQK